MVVKSGAAIESQAPPRSSEKESSRDPGTSERVAALVFVGWIAAAAPLILLHLGNYRWFFSDDWFFITKGEAGSLHDLFVPHNAHWSTVPFLLYRVLWNAFGLHSYVPYQAWTLAAHLTIAVLLRLIMRRAGVGPWLATVAAGAFVLYGPGSDNIIWAFQIGFTAALMLGLVQLLLADHNGRIDTRDWLGLGAGILALMCSGVGVTMAVVVFIAIWLRRGVNVALFHAAPLALAYTLWAWVEHPQVSSPFGRPTAGTIWRWTWSSLVGTFEGLGHFTPVAIALAGLLVAGFVSAWIRPRPDAPGRRRRLALSTGLLAGSVVFALSTVQGRWHFGSEAARSGRYVYLTAACTLPALAIAIQEFGRRRREFVLVGMGLLLVAVPANIGAFEQPPYNESYFANQRRVVLTAPRMPFADDVSRDVRPLPNTFVPPELTIGWLLDAQADGELPEPNLKLGPAVTAEFKVRLGVAQRAPTQFPTACREIRGRLRLAPTRGESFLIPDPVTISAYDENRLGPAVLFRPNDGQLLTIELDDLDLAVEPARASSFRICDP